MSLTNQATGINYVSTFGIKYNVPGGILGEGAYGRVYKCYPNG